MKHGHSAPDLWHLTIDDLLTPPPETPRLGGSGPFVINLSASTAPITIPTTGFPGFEQLRVYQVKRTENNRWRFRLRIGLINTELEADAILAVVRELYPSAFTATAVDDDLRAVSEASRTAQAKRAHATEMIADKPEEDAEPPKAKQKPAAAVAPTQPQPTRWVIMQAPEKKTPPPSEESDIDPNAVTDQVAILKLPNDEAGVELTLDDVVPPPPVTPPKVELPKKAEPPKAAVPPKQVEPKKPEPPNMAEPATKFEPRPLKEIEAELRPLFEPTRKAPPTPASVGDLQAIADLVVIDHDDTLESVVLKNNAMVDSLESRVDVAPQAAPRAAEATAIDLVPELTLEVTDLPVPLAPAATRPTAPPQPQPVVIEASLDELPVLTEAVPVVTKARAPVVEPPRKVREPTAKVSTPPAKAKVSEPAKVVELPVLTAMVNEPPAKPVEAKKFVEFSAQTAKVIEPPKAAAQVAKVVGPTPVVEPVAKVIEAPKVAAPPVLKAKPIEPPAPAKVVEPAKLVEPPRTVKVQLVAGAAAQAVRAASKSHREIARQAKAAAKQSKALNRTSKEVAKATKTSVHPAKAAAHPPKPAEQTKTVVQTPPPSSAPLPSFVAPPRSEPHSSKASARPPKSAAHPPKSAAHPPKAASHPPKGASHPPKAMHAPKVNGHAVVNGQSPKVNGQSHQLNGHAAAPKAAAPAPNGYAPAHNAVPAAAAPVSTALAQPIAPAVERTPAPAPVAKPIEILSEPLPPMDSTQTIRALTPLELADDDGSRWFSIQLSLSEDEVNPESVPHLDIFEEYRLYSVAGLDQGKFLHALRVGFFTDEGAAQAVAGYLKCYFDEPSVKRVSIAERERFAERRMVARKDIGATSTHTIIELATAVPVPETTLADLSQSAIRRLPEDESLLSRLFAQLKR